jgi:hypothetical protein
MVRRVVTVVLAGLVVLGAAGCGSSVSKEDLQSQVSQQLTAQVGQAPESVTCPDDLDAEVGRSTRCQLLTTEGTTYGVGVTVTKVENSNVSFDIQVDPAPAP